MGVDAFVFCNCFETGRLRQPAPPGCVLRIQDDGSLTYESDYTPEVLRALAQWEDHACAHPRLRLVHHRIGNISLVAALRHELAREGSSFPVILSKVLYSGSHAGDWIRVEQVRMMQAEVEALARFRCGDETNQPFMRKFAEQMRELVDSSLRVNKPICF